MLCPFAFSGEVLKLGPAKGFAAVSEDGAGEYDINDYVCLMRETRVFACGDVVRTADRMLMLNITVQNQSLEIGQKVEVKKMKSSPSGRSESPDFIRNPPAFVYDQKNLTVGMSMGFMNVHFSQALSDPLALGLSLGMGSAPAGGGTLSGQDMNVTISYHWGGPFQTGMWATGGVGIYLLTATLGGVTEKGNSIAANAAFGYRYAFDFGLNVAAALGSAYFFNGSLGHTLGIAPGLAPGFTVEAGYSF